MQRNKQVAMGRKKFNMDPKKVGKKKKKYRGSIRNMICLLWFS